MKNILLSLLLLGGSSHLWSQSLLEEQLRQQLQHLQHSDSVHHHPIPPEVSLERVEVEADRLMVHLDCPADFLTEALDEEMLETLIEHFAGLAADQQLAEVHLLAAAADGVSRPLSAFLEDLPVIEAPVHPNTEHSPAIKGRRGSDHYSDVQAKGSLSGKTVWLSAGHGWIYDRRRGHYRTQRGNTHGLVEDFSNSEMINYHLLPYLYRAGANLWTVRERDMNSEEVIVDNDQGRPAYREIGDWETSASSGYRGKTYRYAISQNRTTSQAIFQPNIPKSGLYWVSVRYRSGTNRSVDVRYAIEHAGGISHVSVNQEIHGDTWVYLGQFYFEAGRGSRVRLINASSEKGQAVIADAVRFGGGMGQGASCQSHKHSHEPRYEEGAKYYAQFQGYPRCEGDVVVRPRYAEWELAKGDAEERRNAIYLSWHSNARGGRGTETYIHPSRAKRGSHQLQRMVHDQIIRDIRAGYDPYWRDRGRKAADFGELRGLRTMPGLLIEIGFHDQHEDARALSEPAFRQLVARATYKGIVRYFAARDGRKPVFLPEPPTHVQAKNQANYAIEVCWQAPPYGGVFGDQARRYAVSMSEHPQAFAAGQKTRDLCYTFRGLDPGKTYYFRVTALNAGGESFPTAVVAARTPARNESLAPFLLVDGFDRLDRGLAVIVKDRYPLGQTRRLWLEQMNNYDYAGQHAEAMAAAGLHFDGATNEAIADGKMRLDSYRGVNWYLGRESLRDATLDEREQGYLRRYLDRGGQLIISGSELAYSLDHKRKGRNFYREYLKARYRGDDAGRYRITSFARRDEFGGLRAVLEADYFGAYPLFSPDVITATEGARPILQYDRGKTAAVAYRGRYGLVHFAFPLESVSDPELRAALFRRSLEFLEGEGKSERIKRRQSSSQSFLD